MALERCNRRPTQAPMKSTIKSFMKPYLIKDYTIVSPHALISMNLDVWNSYPKNISRLYLKRALKYRNCPASSFLTRKPSFMESWNL